jgi:hypothetical protein
MAYCQKDACGLAKPLGCVQSYDVPNCGVVVVV